MSDRKVTLDVSREDLQKLIAKFQSMGNSQGAQPKGTKKSGKR
jgi:hypothetical protein